MILSEPSITTRGSQRQEAKKQRKTERVDKILKRDKIKLKLPGNINHNSNNGNINMISQTDGRINANVYTSVQGITGLKALNPAANGHQ